MNLEEFTTRVNSDIVGKLVNIASRCAGFITKNAAGRLSADLPDPALYAEFAAAGEPIAAAYEARDTASAARDIMSLADRANQYIDSHKPWSLAKQADKAVEVQRICTQGLNLFRVLMIYLQPVLPDMAAKARRFFHETHWQWENAATPLLNTAITAYEPLATRLDSKAVSTLVQPENAPPGASVAASAAAPVAASAAAPVAAAAPASAPARAAAPRGASDAATLAAAAAVEGNLISIDEFLRVDLRVAKVLSAESVIGADKLLKLRVDLGELGQRDLFAGIRAAYDSAALVGRLIVVVANLEPRKMRFGVSEGMMLAAGPGGKDIFVLSPDSGATPGMRVK
jgi:methionyl-tRNA synthetase